jgi:hypothetical protein
MITSVIFPRSTGWSGRLDREHARLDLLDVSDGLLGLVAQVLVAEERHRAGGVAGDVEPGIQGEQTRLREHDVRHEGHRHRRSQPLAGDRIGSRDLLPGRRRAPPLEDRPGERRGDVDEVRVQR